ncbi:MAG: GEVED domain-containing protein [Chitinophagales bacterium]
MKNANTNRRIMFALICMLVCAAPAFSQYCIPAYTGGTVEGDYCSYVGLGTINNTTIGAPSPFYSDYTAMSTNLMVGNTYTITVGAGTYASNNDFGIWIDYNSDDDFYDADEFIGSVVDLGSLETGTLTFTVPLLVVGGPTVLRVREIFAMPVAPDPCITYNYGETEDYRVNLIGATIDGGVIDITNPVTAIDMGLESISIVIQNYGSSAISGFPVRYKVNGGSFVTETYTGTIPPYATAPYTFTTPYDFTAEECYTLLTVTNVPGDANPANNALTEVPCNLSPGEGKMYIYSNTTGLEPWGTISNTTALNLAFGPEGLNWQRNYFETVVPAILFSELNCFIFLEGSDAHASELESFLIANLPLIESWVNSGGHLLINSAPNEGDGMNLGFGGTQLIYDGGAGAVTAADPGHPIFSGPFTPAGINYTGSNFSHARIAGPGLTSVIIETGTTDITLGQKVWGTGTVMFGGMTTNNFHDPDPNAANLRANIFSYLAQCDDVCDPGIPTGLFADMITTTKAKLHWSPVLGVDKYSVSVYTAGGALVTKKQTFNNYLTVKDLTPGTAYTFKVRSICLDEGTLSPPSAPGSFTTLLRLGEMPAAFNIYPNPSAGSFNIDIAGFANQTLELNILNSLGQVIYNKNINIETNDHNEQINLDNIVSGIYMISLSNTEINLNYSIVITE